MDNKINIKKEKQTKEKPKKEKTKDDTKQELGQFYTTNYDYILDGMSIPKKINTDSNIIIEPFAGKGDLLKFISDTEKQENKYKFELYDIDPKEPNTIKRDSLLNPPIYTNKFVLTNPPYLAKNKTKAREVFDKYDVDDLYKCFIKELITNNPVGGIIIIPLNFWCSIRKNDIKLREDFLDKFNILRFNIFEEQVFDDTTYTICSFQFALKDSKDEKSNDEKSNEKIKINIYPSKTVIDVEINKSTNFTIGGEIYQLKQNKKYQVDRLTSKNLDKDKEFISNINLKCIDDSKDSLISLSIVKEDERYIDNTENLSARSYATLVIKPKLDLKGQEILVDKFNDFMKKNREKYHSLFLTNYRESNTIARKRISFNLAYEIVNYLLSEFNHS